MGVNSLYWGQDKCRQAGYNVMNGIDIREDAEQLVRKEKRWIKGRQTERSEGIVHEGFTEMRRMPQDGGGGIKAPRNTQGEKNEGEWNGKRRQRLAEADSLQLCHCMRWQRRQRVHHRILLPRLGRPDLTSCYVFNAAAALVQGVKRLHWVQSPVQQAQCRIHSSC